MLQIMLHNCCEIVLAAELYKFISHTNADKILQKKN